MLWFNYAAEVTVIAQWKYSFAFGQCLWILTSGVNPTVYHAFNKYEINCKRFFITFLRRTMRGLSVKVLRDVIVVPTGPEAKTRTYVQT